MGEAEAEKQGKPRVVYAIVAIAVAVAAAVGALVWLEPFATEPAPDEVAEPAAPMMPEFETLVARGEWLFANRGCVACHGERGVGGVANENYILDTVPPVNLMADRLMLFEPEDADAAVALLEEGTDLESLTDDPPFPGYARFLAQYGVVQGVMWNGAAAGKKDPEGAAPPLQMPAWRDILSDEDTRAIIAYTITLYDWEAEEELSDEELGDEEATGALEDEEGGTEAG